MQTDSLYRIGLFYVSPLQENLFCQFRGWKLCIRLDRGYTGALPTAQVLDNTDCENIVLIWDGAYHVFYRENGTVRKETLAGAEVQNVWEIGKRHFPEFDFYNFGTDFGKY